MEPGAAAERAIQQVSAPRQLAYGGSGGAAASSDHSLAGGRTWAARVWTGCTGPVPVPAGDTLRVRAVVSKTRRSQQGAGWRTIHNDVIEAVNQDSGTVDAATATRLPPRPAGRLGEEDRAPASDSSGSGCWSATCLRLDPQPRREQGGAEHRVRVGLRVTGDSAAERDDLSARPIKVSKPISASRPCSTKSPGRRAGPASTVRASRGGLPRLRTPTRPVFDRETCPPIHSAG